MQIHLEQFEGPMGLLLYLIRKEEMDIYDIEIHKITKQYLDYVKRLKNIDLEQAGDFIAMAATLIQIKAKMLMPSYTEDGEEEEHEDPRKPLVQRLLEYQKFQDAGKQLYERPLLGRDTWKRGFKEALPEIESELLLEEENALFSLIKTYRSVLKNVKKTTHKVASKLQSIASRILEIKDKLVIGQKIEMRSLLSEVVELKTLIITFLSSLELGKLGYVTLSQEEQYGSIYLNLKREVGEDIISQVEEYEKVEEAGETGVNTSSVLSAEEQNYLQNEDADFQDKEVEVTKASLSEEEEELVEAESATDEEIEEAEKELNIMEDVSL